MKVLMCGLLLYFNDSFNFDVIFQILAMLGEQFMVESELCGAVVSLRFQV